MEYRMEQLIPIVAELTERYTSKESSSVSYDTAQSLMEAVLYCMDECIRDGQAIMDPAHLPEESALYRRGAGLVIQKTYKAKQIYEAILPSFEDYGCINYRDTILKGIPEFFVRYDPVFYPARHLLTLDYPLLNGNPKLLGIDLILEYLKGIWIEMRFLDTFDPNFVRNLLEQESPEYRELCLDNLCSPVLLHAAVRSVTGRPAQAEGSAPQMGRAEGGAPQTARAPHLTREDSRRLREILSGKTPSETTRCIRKGIREAVLCLPGTAPYFERAADSYASRIRSGIANDCLDIVLNIS